MIKYWLASEGEGRRMSSLDNPAFDLIIREYMNGVWAIFSGILLVFLVWYLIEQYRHHKEYLTIWQFRRLNYIQFAMAMGVVFCAETMRAVWVWAILKRQNDGLPVTFLSSLWGVGLVASVFGVIGALCAIRSLTRDRWGHTGWLTAAVVAVLILLLAELW